MSSPSVYKAVLVPGSHLTLTITSFKDEDYKGQSACAIIHSIAETGAGPRSSETHPSEVERQ